MVVGEVPEGLDLLVVGAGPGGYTAALRAARLGRQVTLVDGDGAAGVGGVCLRTGCIPSKALIEMADTVHRAKAWAPMGHVDLTRFQAFKAQIVRRLGDAVRRQLDEAGVRILQGRFCFTRPGQGAVQRDDGGPSGFVEFQDVILATGSRAVPLEALRQDGEHVMDSAEALALAALPSSAAVIGGGYVGVELGTAFAKLGTKVTIVEAMDRLLPRMPAAVAQPVQRRLAALGAQVLLGAQASDFDGTRLKVETAHGFAEVEAAVVIVAVGRRPNTDNLGLELIGVRPGPGGRLEVARDRRLAPHVAAIGDLTPGPALAHKATAEAEVAADALCGRPAVFDPAAIPAVVFGDPEVATAGLSAEDARAAGITVRIVAVPLAVSGRAATMGAGEEGFARLVVDTDADAIVGAQIVGPHASELISEAVLAIEMAASPADLAATIHPHPTLSELLADAARRA
ncbi:MAG: dihydrolipoyl dehydrogenase family protein [Egibacteraceae bacterium]